MSAPKDTRVINRSGQQVISRQLGRGCLLLLGVGLASFLALLLGGALYEFLAEAADAQAYPPPGQQVDVGGYRLHINCTGEGSPTVVIEAGLGDWSTTWGATVQPEVAKTTRVCTYDRAGMGWSDPDRFPAMRLNLPGSCIRCCTTRRSRDLILWWGILWGALSSVYSSTIIHQRLPGLYWSS